LVVLLQIAVANAAWRTCSSELIVLAFTDREPFTSWLTSGVPQVSTIPFNRTQLRWNGIKSPFFFHTPIPQPHPLLEGPMALADDTAKPMLLIAITVKSAAARIFLMSFFLFSL
jgi:hypothetical protein